MEPKDNNEHSRRQIRFIWNRQDNFNPFEDPDLLKQLEQMMNEVFDNLENSEEDDTQILPVVQAELDCLEDIDNMVVGEEHPIALKWIVDAYKNNRDK